MTQDLLKIPYQQLSADVLEGIIREFVLREGTDYGTVEYSLDQKVGHVRAQLEAGKACIVFNPLEQSCDIVTVSAFERLNNRE